MRITNRCNSPFGDVKKVEKKSNLLLVKYQFYNQWVPITIYIAVMILHLICFAERETLSIQTQISKACSIFKSV